MTAGHSYEECDRPVGAAASLALFQILKTGGRWREKKKEVLLLKPSKVTALLL